MCKNLPENGKKLHICAKLYLFGRDLNWLKCIPVENVGGNTAFQSSSVTMLNLVVTEKRNIERQSSFDNPNLSNVFGLSFFVIFLAIAKGIAESPFM